MCNSLTRDRGRPLTLPENFAEGNRLNFLILGISLNEASSLLTLTLLQFAFFFFFLLNMENTREKVDIFLEMMQFFDLFTG